MPGNSGFILGFENQAGDQSRQNGGGDASGGGFQPSGENAEETVFLHRLLDALGKSVAEARQGNGSACRRMRILQSFIMSKVV